MHVRDPGLEYTVMRRFTLLIVGLLTVLVLWPAPVRAHAAPAESTPAANSVLAEAPPTARIRFTEPMDSTYSRATLLGPDGTQLSTVPSRVDAQDAYVMLLDLPTIPEGRYIIQWRALSTADGHTSEGTVSFGIGDPSSATAPLVLPSRLPDPLALPSTVETLLRWLSVGGLVLTMGSLLFGLAIWRRGAWSSPETDAIFGSFARRLELGGATVAALATLGLLLAAGANPILFAITSRVGFVLALRGLLVVLLLTVLWRSDPWRRVGALLIGAAAVLAVSLLSHAAVPQVGAGAAVTFARTAFAVLFDWVHLLATAAWIGGLVPLLGALVVLRRETPPSRTQGATVLVARFTGLATAAVMLLAVTGTAAAVQHISTLSELWTTTYGRALSLKLFLFGVLLALGGYNRWRINPALRALGKQRPGEGASERLLGRLRRSVTTEIVLGSGVLLAVGVLTAVVPAREAGRGQAFADSARVGNVLLQLQAVPADVAGDVFALDVQGLPAGVEPEVVLRSAMTTHHAGNEELRLAEVEPGHWGARGSLLAIAGRWDVEAIVRAPGMDDVRHVFTIDTSTPATFARVSVGLPLWALLLVVSLIAGALSQLPLRGRWPYWFQSASLVVVMGAFVAAVVPYYVTRAYEPTHPLADTPDVVAAGQDLYQKNCVACHGISGRGDGPAARTLPGLPGDFTQPHFATHTDGEVFGWIESGKPGTAMPAFEAKLSEEQIWQVMTHIRSIYRDAQQGATGE